MSQLASIRSDCMVSSYNFSFISRYELYLDRLVDRIKLEQGITFDEFRAFCQFLNNLDDFNVAMKMYTLADRPISQDEFRRAVRICTGTDLSPHVVETVFQIFDEDDDGHLSHREFIGVMKDRLHRGFKVKHFSRIRFAFHSKGMILG
jgi:Ca2+-binding EF-hand superfamily protein